MPSFHGVNHVALSVTDLDVSERFYTTVLGLLTVIDVGHARVCMDTATGFTIALVRHPDGSATAFTERATGLDHLGLAVTDRAALVEWEGRLRDAGVDFTPIQDTPLGHHLNFRDPDGIALELQAPTPMYAAALGQLSTRTFSDAEILAIAEQMLGSEVARAPDPRT